MEIEIRYQWIYIYPCKHNVSYLATASHVVNSGSRSDLFSMSTGSVDSFFTFTSAIFTILQSNHIQEKLEAGKPMQSTLLLRHCMKSTFEHGQLGPSRMTDVVAGLLEVCGQPDLKGFRHLCSERGRHTYKCAIIKNTNNKLTHKFPVNFKRLLIT